MAEAVRRSLIDGVIWPAVPTGRAAAIGALLFQLDETQWWPPERIAARQRVQLRTLLEHAWDTVPYYRARLAAAGCSRGDIVDAEAWTRLPLLRRQDIQSAGEALWSTRLPPGHGPTIETRTSGATGQPVVVIGTQPGALMWDALTVREHLWHRRDLTARLAVIRANVTAGAGAGGVTRLPDWGAPANLLFETGPAAAMGFDVDVAAQIDWLVRNGPEYLLTYPNNLAALLGETARRGVRLPRLREVRTIGETLRPELRTACRDVWGVPVVDVYSSQEVGYMAVQCPDAATYHVMSESVLVELLRSDGTPCGPGETGRVVVTALHNFAMPLIRYELRDYAEQGAGCSCGRGLPVIKRVLGRSRNLLRLPDGTSRWPLVGFHAYRDIAPIRQYQIVQRSLEEIEARFVADRTLSADEEARLAEVLRGALGHPFRVVFTYFDGEIPRSAGGKFEEFVSAVV